MRETENSEGHHKRLCKEAPQLTAVLKEMKEGLDAVRNKVQTLTSKVKSNDLPTADGIDYLEAKHLLLLNYCQSLVYYLLRKAKGLSIDGHPVTRSLVEIRLFLEKVRPIDKKLEYQIQKLSRAANGTGDQVGLTEKDEHGTENPEDPLRYRPNPDMLVSKVDLDFEDGAGVYRPPKFAPMAMEEEEKTSKQERNRSRMESNMLRRAKQNQDMRDLLADVEGRPEEVRETIGVESNEVLRFKAKMDDRASREEELFTRAPLTRIEKKKLKQMEKSSNGLQSLTDDFNDIVKSLPLGDSEQMPDMVPGGSGEKKFKKRKRKY